jgi:hypothetical protein
MIQLNESAVLDVLLSDENFMKTIGCLEFDPDLPTSTADYSRHRNFLSK